MGRWREIRGARRLWDGPPAGGATRVVALAGLLALAACGGPRVHEVVIQGNAYHPQVVEARPGDAVRWINRDMVLHTATAVGGQWDSGVIPVDSAWTLALSDTGRVEYFCTLHPGMRGYVEVRSSE